MTQHIQERHFDIVSGRPFVPTPSFEQMAHEGAAAASEAYEKSLLARLGPEQYAEIVAARAEAAAELDQQNEAA